MKIKLLLTLFAATFVLCNLGQAADIYCPQTINCDSNGQCDNIPSPFQINTGYKIAPGTYIFTYATTGEYGIAPTILSSTQCEYAHANFPQPTFILEIYYGSRATENNMLPDTKIPNEWVSRGQNGFQCENRLTQYCPLTMTPPNNQQ